MHEFYELKLTKLKQTVSVEEGKKYMAKRISGKTKDYNRNAFDFKDNSNELIDIRKQLLINNNNPIVVIYGHAYMISSLFKYEKFFEFL